MSRPVDTAVNSATAAFPQESPLAFVFISSSFFALVSEIVELRLGVIGATVLVV